MNKKGFVNIIIVIVGVIILAGVAGYFIVKQQTPSLGPVPLSTPTPTPSSISQPTTQLPLAETPRITGVAAESRKRFIDAGLTEQFFNQNFKLRDTKSGTDAGGRYTYVYWIYTIKEYQTEIVDRVNHDRPAPITTTLHDIKVVIPFQQAIDTLSSCIGKNLAKKETLIEYDYQSGQTGEKGGGLYLAGSTRNEREGFVEITRTRVNLENGKCDPLTRDKIFR
jgi:hypothetical protein